MNLLTDGTANNPILRFCLDVVSRHGESWPPAEEILVREFVDWFGCHPFVGKEQMTRLCAARGVILTFVSLPQEIRGVNCSFGNKREIVICQTQTAPFDLHTLFHEFREMLEHDFRALGHPIIRPNDSLEVQAEQFAILCRMEAASRQFPGLLQMADNVQNKWMRYLSFALVIIFSAAHLFHCIFTPQMEEVVAEARRQRYVRM